MNIIYEFDTITAISTPFGTGGVAVIRISGDKSFEIIKKISTAKNLIPKEINFTRIIDKNETVDEVIVLPFKSPNSYTGEDVIEIQCHGGINITRKILKLVLNAGARHAERGEFTKRAFLNKKIDLSQAEAVSDLIHSKTESFVKTSAKNLSGMLSIKITKIKNRLFDLISKITAGIDFPDDVKEPEYEYIISEINLLIMEINGILDSANASNVLRQGVTVAIAGCPNTGKSSLFNMLLNSERAIVTDIEGTTRDIIKETLDLGIPVTLTDTAGIRNCNNISDVEKIGIEYTKHSVESADLVLFLYDASKGLTAEDETVRELIKTKKFIQIANKCDLAAIDTPDVKISAKTGEGIEELKLMIKDRVCGTDPETLEFSTNLRQQDCLSRSNNSLQIALDAAKRNDFQDLILIDLKSALIALGEITGETITDDILDNIFKNFCIGK